MMSRLQFKDFNIQNEEHVKEYYELFQPTGSGPLTMMKLVCIMLEQIAEDKGYDLSSIKRVRAL